MGVLRSIEHGIESLVEGVFGRAFRSNVQPVELARKLAKEMDDHRAVSVSRVYVPNEYLLYLSPEDRAQLPIPEESLLAELADYLTEHARRQGYSLLTSPRVVLEEDGDLAIGEFGIATRVVQPRRAGPAPIPPPTPAAPPLPSPPPPPPPEPTHVLDAVAERTLTLPAAEAARLGLAHAPALLRIADDVHELTARRAVIGRSRDCDVVLTDGNVSRRHAEIRQEESGFYVVDLGSTNGTALNGLKVDRARLEPGDRIVIGTTEMTFERH
jgi:hypothetical protein